MSEVLEFEDRLSAVNGRIRMACDKAGRSLDSVKLLAVSKTKPPEAIELAAKCGLRFFGENKVQEAQAKVPVCSDHIEWHLIGHLQSNKAKIAANLFHMVHSVDSLKIMRALDNYAEQTLPILLQVNIAGDAAKFGLKPEEVSHVLKEANQSLHCEVRGLMTIPPFSPDPEKTRKHFYDLRILRDELEQEAGIPLPELSMGMSHDLEVAIEEGSTWIRVGTDLFGARV
jgi:hypothetical protein